MNISGPGSSASDPSRLSATMPMIWRSGSSANSFITPRPMISRSFSGSPFGQKRFAIASLIITTGGELFVSRSLKARPRLTGILNTSK